MNTVQTLKQLLPGIVRSDYEYNLRQITSIELINETIVADILLLASSDECILNFCDTMEHLCDRHSVDFIRSFRNGMCLASYIAH